VTHRHKKIGGSKIQNTQCLSPLFTQIIYSLCDWLTVIMNKVVFRETTFVMTVIWILCSNFTIMIQVFLLSAKFSWRSYVRASLQSKIENNGQLKPQMTKLFYAWKNRASLTLINPHSTSKNCERWRCKGFTKRWQNNVCHILQLCDHWGNQKSIKSKCICLF